MTEASAVVIAHSVTEQGWELVTVQEKFWRPVLAERNTHCIQKKNSASSRAIPFEEMLRRFDEDPADPLVWASEKPGMSGGDELEGKDLADAQSLWADIKALISGRMHTYIEDHPDKSTRLHKSVLNRALEFGQWHTATITATGWENYFEQRCTEFAQPEIRAVAEAARDAIRASTPVVVHEGEWHTPYIRPDDHDEICQRAGYVGPVDIAQDYPWAPLIQISAARVGRTSYLTQDGIRDLEEDVRLYQKLLLGPHWSPLEQVATPDGDNVQQMPYTFENHLGNEASVLTKHLPRVGPFPGWRTMRTEVEATQKVVTYR